MSKSKYSPKLRGGLKLLKRLHDGEIGRLQRASEDDRIPILEAWEDLAGSERLVKENHESRYLFELIQNANDALADADFQGREHVNKCVRIELTNDALIVANFGLPFGEDNVRALRRLHKTTKKMGVLKDETGKLSQSKKIGHKGIGFKSVLDISSRPEVYSDIYSFVFDQELFRRDVDNIINDADNWTLPTFRVPYPIYINQLPQTIRSKIDQLFDAGYVTIIRLPLDDPLLVDDITLRIEQDIQPDLLLFMSAISRIEINFPDGYEIAYTRKAGSVGETGLDLVSIEKHGSEGTKLVSKWLTLQATRHIDDRSLLSGLGEAWKDVEALGFAIAFPLSKPDRNESVSQHESPWPSEPFHVYYPTHEYSGLSFKVHGDFYVGDNRKSIPPDKPINQWLMNEICEFIASESLDCLKRQWPYEAELVHRLVPIDRPKGAFAQAFMDTYLYVLRISPFVPIPGQNYKPPEEIRLPPKEADQELFCNIFPPSRIRGNEKWAYPIEDVVESEFLRSEYLQKKPDAIQFLQRRELGCESITIDEVVAALEFNGMPAIEEADDLISVLASWYIELPGIQRRHFIEALKTLPIYPTASGWRKPGEELIFQANLREDMDEPTLPEGFSVSVIRRSAYPAGRGASNSNEYQLFSDIGAREYSRRSLIVEAILPKLTDEELFQELRNNYPNSIYDVFVLLKDYYENDGTTTGFENRLWRVPVPTKTKNSWHPAQNCFFGNDWPSKNGKLLERVFGGFEDSHFLADIPQLLTDQDETHEDWAYFFNWLGVADRPNIIEGDKIVYRTSPSPIAELSLWEEYLKDIADEFKCPNPAANHGFSRRLLSVNTIDHFVDLLHEQDNQKLIDLFVLLASYWESEYKDHARSLMACDRSTCAQNQVENYLLFELQNAQWVPAKVSNNWVSPLSPKQIWILGETDPADARALVPTLPEELLLPKYREFINALGFVTSSSAGIEDYVRLLRLMPERYPVEPQELSDNEKRQWQRSLSAVFNWICERLQTGLMSRGDNAPQIDNQLKILAYRGDQPSYVSLGSPELVYPDNAFLADRWSNNCAYIRTNDDWRTLLNWLDIPNLSEIIDSDWQPGGILDKATQDLQRAFAETLPYYLALIKHTQPANYERLIPRLYRLNMFVVKELQVKEWLKLMPDIEPVSSSVQIHLTKRDEPNPGAGRRFVMAGDLYITKEATNNLDLLGEYVADYIEILRLSDAFVILINRREIMDKWRFLKSKGVSENTLSEVINDMKTRSAAGEVDIPGHQNIEDILNKIKASKGTPEISPTATPKPAPSNGKGDDVPGGDGSEDTMGEGPSKPSKPSKPEYPELDLSDPPGVNVGDTDGIGKIRIHKGTYRGGAGGGGGPGSVPSQEVTEELGRRGEIWSYENEKKRLRDDYGLDPSELEERNELSWVANQKRTANFDIKSIRITETGEHRTLYIEVKATTGDSRRIKMSRQEFHLAMSLGEDYWLYWVANVNEARPDPPVGYENIAKLVAEEKVVIDVDTLDITLPNLLFGGEENKKIEV